jgi:hypothetical protein
MFIYTKKIKKLRRSDKSKGERYQRQGRRCFSDLAQHEEQLKKLTLHGENDMTWYLDSGGLSPLHAP